MSFDANAHRESSLQGWEEAAAGWVRSGELVRAFGAPVSHWMLDAVAPQPGQRVLELAAGLGETGLLAAELVAPVGGVVISDQADAMLSGARERAAELGLANVEFQAINAEWIDLPVASVDAVLCRWGYMLMADPAAALGETRRVLRSGGRVGLAVWDAIEHNPWASLPGAELRAHCAAALAPFKVPKRVIVREQTLPRTPSGKLLRRELRRELAPALGQDGRSESGTGVAGAAASGAAESSR